MKKIIHTITNWEAWPFKLLYTPISLVWLWYIIRSRAVWFFTSSNPKITFGGMEGEPKKEMYDLLPTELYPPTFYVLPEEKFDAIQQRLIEKHIHYPFIVKPEIGGQGILLRKIHNATEWQHYHTHMPWEYIVQAFVAYPMEVSVFYIRHPQAQKGIVTGFLHKIPLHVTGDGLHTLGELIARHSKTEKFIDSIRIKHMDKWNDVLPQDERYMLSYAANHNRGARFVDLKEQIDEQLVSIFDAQSHRINDFFYGRYDIMCNSVEDLKAGKNFAILEYNGCGAEPNHFYDTGYTLGGAYKEILKHWKALYEISKYNRSQGIEPWPLNKGRKFLTDIRKKTVLMKQADKAMG